MAESKRSRSDESTPLPIPKTAKLESTEPEYIIDSSMSLRRVAPYWHTFKINAKGRWFKRTLLSMFTEEFKDQTEEYYKRAITSGKICVNNEIKPFGYIIKNGDVVSHSVHRHEPPVTSDPIRVVFQDAEVLVVDKPSGIPVHPTGGYNFNTVSEILKSKEFGFPNVYSVNRIDRLTSGILLFALTKSKASELQSQLQDRAVSKTYLCRVRGKFPEGSTTSTEPILVTTNKLGVNITHPSGLPSSTTFHFLSHNTTTNTSLVQAHPTTGRMHQIRIHLQFLGHPIANDPLYADVKVWGDACGKGGGVDMEAVSARIKAGKVKRGVVEEDEIRKAGEGNGVGEAECLRCVHTMPDPTREQLKMDLHSWKYSGEGWAYETERPEWAVDGFVE
ncbi:hypothetical protein HDU98_003493 [Podochytrium sp. JEL0797]|nr:hypothetical protein HDU98_003493 [Podochytrium sp. JEL0797]